MQFGCTLPNRGDLTSADNLKVMAQTAEKNGFDSVWVSDHIVIPTDIAPLYPYSDSGELPFNPDSPYCEPLTTLAFLSGITSSIRLGTHVLVLPYRNPVLAAKMISTLDFLSGGRVILGIGAGWMEEEFEALDSPPFPHRGRVTDEYLEIYRELWTNTNPSSKVSLPTHPVTSFLPSLSSSQGLLSGSAATAAPPSDAPPDTATHGSPLASVALLGWSQMNSKAKYSSSPPSPKKQAGTRPPSRLASAPTSASITALIAPSAGPSLAAQSRSPRISAATQRWG